MSVAQLKNAAPWRGGRVVEGARLERVYTGNRIEGSNPSLSAMYFLFVVVISVFFQTTLFASPFFAPLPVCPVASGFCSQGECLPSILSTFSHFTEAPPAVVVFRSYPIRTYEVAQMIGQSCAVLKA